MERQDLWVRLILFETWLWSDENLARFMILNLDLGQEVAKNRIGLISVTSVDHVPVLLFLSISCGHCFIINAASL